MRPGPKVVFQYELRFVNRLQCQLLISHLLLPIKFPGQKERWEIKRLFGDIPTFFELFDQLLFQGIEPSGCALRATPGRAFTRKVLWLGPDRA